jgi:hypothetical protein
MLDSVRGGRGRLYFQRQSPWELCAAAEAWLTELIHRRPARWRQDVEDCLPQSFAGSVPIPSRSLAKLDRLIASYTPRHLAAKILTSRIGLEGERKQVTVLFADLKGSMELLAHRDLEEARRILAFEF